MIYIVTVFDSINYGSFFQALSLYELLKKYGTVYFVDVNHQSILKQTVTKIIGHIYKLRFAGIIYEIRKYFIFKKYQKRFNVIKKSKIKSQPSDIYIFGSDEIWNINRKKFLNTTEFFGKDFIGHKIAYAPSINNTSSEEFIRHSDLLNLISKFDFISLRDKTSYDVINKLIDCKISIVEDPTFLYGIDKFKCLEENISFKNEKYIIIYTYGRMCNTPESIENIKLFAKKNNSKIFSIGKYLPWCDKCINVTPGEFLSCISNAEYILTDTFHGTVFSILYRKNFINVNPSKKIIDLLDDLGLQDSIVYDTKMLNSKLDYNLDYSKAAEKQNLMVKNSKEYLFSSVEKCMLKGEQK